MCGILGWVGGRGSKDLERFGKALDLLQHRGPDDRGIWVGQDILLGHRRLSILDLSEAGHQPMIDEASGAILVFNGEIFNYLELRCDLQKLGYQFKGRSDTEVLLYSLIHWGEEIFSRLNGMWAIAFWNPSTKRLILSRDRFGEKPLYYRNKGNGLAFASEPKSLLYLFPEHKQASQEVVLDFLVNNLLYARNESFYQGISLLSPAHYAIFDSESDQFRLVKFWDYPNCTDEQLSQERAAAQFDWLFNDAVKLRMQSDVPVGLTLSGGLDSTSILTATSKSSPKPLTSFTSVYGESNSGELSWAKIASEAAQSRLIAVSAVSEEWLSNLREITWHMDGPGYSPAVYPQWCLMRHAKIEGVPVLLEGQGADEALAGYPQYLAQELLNYLKKVGVGEGNLKGLARRVSGMHRTFGPKPSLAWIMRQGFGAGLKDWHRRQVGFESIMRNGLILPKHPNHIAQNGVNQILARLKSDHSINILPGLLHYGDAISMAHGIETRNPFLDYRLVEFMFKLPMSIMFKEGQTKWILRDYLRNNDQPMIGNRYDKKGYPTAVKNWLNLDDGKLIEQLLLDKRSQLYEWCDPTKVQRMIHLYRQGNASIEHHLYKLVSTKIWLETCLDG